MKKKNTINNVSRPYVFVPMSADILHHGHINILQKSKKLGNVVVGLMTDKGISSYKGKKPFLKYKNRKKILQEIKSIDKIIPINGLLYEQFAKKYKFDFFVHGSDWKKGPQSEQRKRLKKIMRTWGGKVVEYTYTAGISSTKIKNNIYI